MLSDARIYQILFLALFLIVGMVTRDWTLQPGMIGIAIATCLLTQTAALALKQYQTAGIWRSETQKPAEDTESLKALGDAFRASAPSALITSLGLSVLLRTDDYRFMVLASVAAIASKFLLRVQDKHVFNPGNFGIITALTFGSHAWVTPGQWGEEGWYALMFLATGGLVVQRVGRWDTTAAFLGSYAALEAIRNIFLGWTWDVWLHRLMSGSLLMFALFMITDPRTLPNARAGRLIWAGAIALLTFFLRNYCFVSTAVFWALFVLAPLIPLLDQWFAAPRFLWIAKPASTTAESSQVAVAP